MGLFHKAAWREAGTVSEFEQTDRKLLDFGEEQQIGLFKVDGAYYAISVWCSHEKKSMIQGDVEGCELMCPEHGARFDLRTGKNKSLPAVRPVPSYPVKLEGDTLWVKV